MRASLTLVGLLAFSLAATGCATKKDTRYRSSVLLPPLMIPADLDAPPYTQTMDIPPVTAQPPVDEDEDIERPPAIVPQDQAEK